MPQSSSRVRRDDLFGKEGVAFRSLEHRVEQLGRGNRFEDRGELIAHLGAREPLELEPGDGTAAFELAEHRGSG